MATSEIGTTCTKTWRDGGRERRGVGGETERETGRRGERRGKGGKRERERRKNKLTKNNPTNKQKTSPSIGLF